MKREKQKAKEKRKDVPIGMQSSKEQQGEIRKASSVISAKKQRETVEWERLEISRKIGEIKGAFHAGMSTIKDRNCKDLTEADNIKRRWQENRRTILKRL